MGGLFHASEIFREIQRSHPEISIPTYLTAFFRAQISHFRGMSPRNDQYVTTSEGHDIEKSNDMGGAEKDV